MTLEQYWDDDPYIVRYYRDKARCEMKRENFNAWNQGMYIYDLLGRLREALMPFVKDPHVKPYVDKPYPQTEEEFRAIEEEKARLEMEETREFFMNQVRKQNKRRKEEEDKCQKQNLPE